MKSSIAAVSFGPQLGATWPIWGDTNPYMSHMFVIPIHRCETIAQIYTYMPAYEGLKLSYDGPTSRCID